VQHLPPVWGTTAPDGHLQPARLCVGVPWVLRSAPGRSGAPGRCTTWQIVCGRAGLAIYVRERSISDQALAGSRGLATYAHGYGHRPHRRLQPATISRAGRPAAAPMAPACPGQGHVRARARPRDAILSLSDHRGAAYTPPRNHRRRICLPGDPSPVRCRPGAAERPPPAPPNRRLPSAAAAGRGRRHPRRRHRRRRLCDRTATVATNQEIVCNVSAHFRRRFGLAASRKPRLGHSLQRRSERSRA
jgi:hypothetical protein